MKLDYKRTILVGLAFLSISAFWQMYDSVVPLILTNNFALNETWSGAIMAADNILALFLLPFFGALSDRVKTPIGRRMPFILFGTACAAVLVVTCLVQGYGLFNYGPSAIVVGALLAIFSTILGHSIFSWCLKFFSPSFVSASKLCEPVAAAAMAMFLFAEIPTLFQILGGVLILGGVCWYSGIERKTE